MFLCGAVGIFSPPNPKFLPSLSIVSNQIRILTTTLSFLSTKSKHISMSVSRSSVILHRHVQLVYFSSCYLFHESGDSVQYVQGHKGLIQFSISATKGWFGCLRHGFAGWILFHPTILRCSFKLPLISSYFARTFTSGLDVNLYTIDSYR